MADSKGSAKHLKNARWAASDTWMNGAPPTLEQATKIADSVYDQVVGDVRAALENYERLLEDAPIGLRPVEVSPSEFIWTEFVLGRVE